MGPDANKIGREGEGDGEKISFFEHVLVADHSVGRSP
jgi:hypothetical protein